MINSRLMIMQDWRKALMRDKASILVFIEVFGNRSQEPEDDISNYQGPSLMTLSFYFVSTAIPSSCLSFRTYSTWPQSVQQTTRTASARSGIDVQTCEH
jgi:hypothetical protein